VNEAIRRQALRSAAKVAFGATLVWGAALSGCGGQSVSGTSVDDDRDESDLGSSSGERRAEPKLACNVPTAELDAVVQASADRATYACCADYVATKLPSDEQLTPDVPELTRDPAVVECCRYVNAAYDRLLDGPFPFAVQAFCCRPGVLSDAEHEGVFCSPWGPPVPPSLALELEFAA
jgi:hypothetical protein